MRASHGRFITITSLDQLDRMLAGADPRLAGWRIVGLDLTERSAALRAHDTSRTTFAGCRFADDEASLHAARGALVLPGVAQTPVDVRRDALYTAEELIDARPYERSLDARAFAWLHGTGDPDDLLAQALHDEGIDRALERWVDGRRIVGVMGGHALERGSTGYAHAARLGRLLAQEHRDRPRLTVATGGGPGAMEAVSLGARLAARPEPELRAAIALLAGAPSFRPSVDAWLAPALAVLRATPDPVDSLGIPTWHFGHEPPSVFPTAIAKFFRNALRESVLLEVSNAGVVVLPGAAGTVQEIFQDACENYYAQAGAVAPMVLVGHRHWTETLPAWPLLRALAQERAMAEHIHLVDTVEEADDIIR